jgi:hypothetical protein
MRAYLDLAGHRTDVDGRLFGPLKHGPEFPDDRGRTYAQLALPEHQLLVLHYQPQHAA